MLLGQLQRQQAAGRVLAAVWRREPVQHAGHGRPLASNSAAIVGRLTSASPQPDKVTTGDADTPGDWSHPIYFSQPSDPVYTRPLHRAVGHLRDRGHAGRDPRRRPGRPGGSDGHMAVIDQASGWEYDFWQVSSKPDGGGRSRSAGAGARAIDGRRPRLDRDRRALRARRRGDPSRRARRRRDQPRPVHGRQVHQRHLGLPGGPRRRPRLLRDRTLKRRAPAMGQRFFLDMTRRRDRRSAVPEPGRRRS